MTRAILMKSSSKTTRCAIRTGAVLAALALAPAAGLHADNPLTLADAVRARAGGGDATPTPDEPAATSGAAEGGAVDLAGQWGIEVTSIRLTAHDHMIDFRYRVLDSARAGELFERKNKPRLIHQETGKVLGVPETAKVGPLRNSDIPQQGRIYWMFFGNAGGLVTPGDKVTVVIGDFRAEDLVVE
jgi:hypothetical protein